MSDFISLVADYDGIKNHGLRIVRDELYDLLADPRNIELGTVQGLLAGFNIALNAVPITPETLSIRDELQRVLDEIFPVAQRLNSEDWESDNCALCDESNSIYN